jgi:seryl-tRNA synthetase
MTISKKSFDALKNANLPDDVMAEIEAENESLKKFEGDDRLFEKMKKQLGDNSIEDLLKAKASLDTIGGVEKVKEIELSKATTEKEKAELEAKYKGLNDSLAEIKGNSEKLSNELKTERLKNTLLPHMEAFNSDMRNTIMKEWLSDGVVSIGDDGSLMVKDGASVLPFDKGFEALKLKYPSALAKPQQQQYNADPANPRAYDPKKAWLGVSQ